MELQEFIRKTLVNVVEGVRAAQEETEKTGANINPMAGPFTGSREARPLSGLTKGSSVVFDVALGETQAAEVKPVSASF